MIDTFTQRSDDTVRELVSKKINGLYASVICRHCLNFLSNPDCYTKNAEITDHCPKCHPDLEAWRQK